MSTAQNIRTLFCAPTNASCEDGALRFLQNFDDGKSLDIFSSSVGATRTLPPPMTLGDVVITGNADRLDVLASDLGKIFVCQVSSTSGQPGSKKNRSRQQRLSGALSLYYGCAATARNLRGLFDTGGESFNDKRASDNNMKEKTVSEYLRVQLHDLEEGSLALRNDLPSNLLPDVTRRQIVQLLPRIETVLSSTISFHVTDREVSRCLPELSLVDDRNFAAAKKATREGLIGFMRSLRGFATYLTPEVISTLTFSGVPDSPSPEKMADMCITHARVVFCTVSSTGKQSLRDSGRFTLVVVDEAAQSIEAENMLPCMVSGVELMILVGDTRQLPATVLSQVKTSYFNQLLTSFTHAL